VDTYVRVNGRLNSFSNRISVVAHSMRPVEDFNEISFHFLEAIETHFLFVKPGSTIHSSSNVRFILIKLFYHDK
jgi:replication factor A2